MFVRVLYILPSNFTNGLAIELPEETRAGLPANIITGFTKDV
jgi:hypothetical protein